MVIELLSFIASTCNVQSLLYMKGTILFMLILYIDRDLSICYMDEGHPDIVVMINGVKTEYTVLIYMYGLVVSI